MVKIFNFLCKTAIDCKFDQKILNLSESWEKCSFYFDLGIIHVVRLQNLLKS